MLTTAEKWLLVLLSLVVICLLGLATLSITASGKIDYCYIETMRYINPVQGDVVSYSLHGHRNWRPDRMIVDALPSLEVAKTKAEIAGCELR